MYYEDIKSTSVVKRQERGEKKEQEKNLVCTVVADSSHISQ